MPFLDGSNNVVKSTGPNIGTWNAHFYRSAYSLADGEGLQLRFKVNSSDTQAHFSIEANDATYRRFGVIADQGKLYVQYTLDGAWVYPADVLPSLQTNTWYVLQIGVDDAGSFSVLAYKESDPSVRGAYSTPTPASARGKAWRFHHWINRNTAYVDDYREFSGPVYRYDAGTNGAGRRTSMSDASGSTAWTYDDRGRVTQESKTISGSGTFNTYYSYDAADRVKTTTYPGGEVVTTAYNAQGLPKTLTSSLGATYVDEATYNALGQPTLVTFGGASLDLQTQYSYYSDDQRLQEMRVGTSGWTGKWSVLKYQYDNVGNVASIKDYRWVGGSQLRQDQSSATTPWTG